MISHFVLLKETITMYLDESPDSLSQTRGLCFQGALFVCHQDDTKSTETETWWRGRAVTKEGPINCWTQIQIKGWIQDVFLSVFF